jgi:hypothetical protein
MKDFDGPKSYQWELLSKTDPENTKDSSELAEAT